MAKFCDARVREYEHSASKLTDVDLSQHLFEYYREPLDGYQLARPDYRKWRRLIIAEGLNRGLITKDPGVGRIEED